MASLYVYMASDENDVKAKVAGCTGTAPTSVVHGFAAEVAITYADKLTADEKDRLDEFMRTRGYEFARLIVGAEPIDGKPLPVV